MPPDEGAVKFNRNTPVRERTIPGYEAPGVRLGSFTLSPSLALVSQVNDNIFALDTPKISDESVRITPAARLQSNWSTTSLSVSAAGQIERYVDNPSENVNGGDASAYLTHEFGANTRLRAYAQAQFGRESRESQDAFALTNRPISYSTQTAALAIAHRFASARLSAEAGITRANYADAMLGNVELDQDYRNNTLKRASLRAEIVGSPSLAYFAQGTVSGTNYDQPVAATVGRSSRSYELVGGVRMELPTLMRGEVALGYLKSEYRGTIFRGFSGFAADVRLQLFPSQLTTVTLTGRRKVNDSGLPGSSGYLTTSVGLQVDHELLRSLILGGGIQVQRDVFNGIDRRDRRLSGSVSADYRLNRSLSVRTSYEVLDLASTGLGSYKSFSRNRVMLSLGFRI